MILDNMLYLPLNGDANDDSPHARTPSVESGGVIYSSEHAQIGQAAQFAGATTNFVINPRGAIDLTNWDLFSGVSGSAVSDPEAPNGTAFRFEITGDISSNVAFASLEGEPLSIGADYAGQFWIKGEGSAVGKTGQLLFWETGGVSPAQSIAQVGIILTENYQLINGIGQLNQADRTNVWLYVQLVNDAIGDVLLVADAQVENNAHLTPYCDGSLGAGHSWSGAAHNSNSSRTATDLRYALALPDEFTISTILTPFPLPSELTADGWYWQWRFDANNYVGLRADESSDAVILEWVGNGAPHTIADIDLTRFQKYEYTITYDGTTLTLSRDGASVGTPVSDPTAFAAIPDTLHIGSASGASHANAWLDEFIVEDAARASAAVQQLYDNHQAGIPYQYASGLLSAIFSAKKPSAAFSVGALQ